jgi:two-component system sensor histidine kinase TtrS
MRKIYLLSFLATIIFNQKYVIAEESLTAVDEPVVIGVLAYRGSNRTLSRWMPTADYLNSKIPGYHFLIKPLDHKSMREAVERNHLDFILTNPGHYVDLEATFGITRLTTLTNLRVGRGVKEFGAVIFTRAQNKHIQSLNDMKGKTMMAVSPSAFGGFQLAWYEMVSQGVNPFTDLKQLVFNGFPQDDIVYAVREGQVDIGTVRADVLHRMAAEEVIRLSEFRILNTKFNPIYPFKHSTKLYPEWPFAKARHTDDDLSKKVAIALLTMKSTDAAAIKGSYIGWNVPSDYRPVHELFYNLKIGPYKSHNSIEFFIDSYGQFIFLVVGLISFLVLTTLIMVFLNFKLSKSKNLLKKEVANHKNTVSELWKLSRALEQTTETIIITDENGLIEYVNPAFERLTGFSLIETVGFNPSILKSDEHESSFYKNVWRTISSGRIFQGVFINRCSDGSLLYEQKTITPLRDESGKIIHYIATGKDITEQKIVAKQHDEHQQQLAHVSRVSMMGEMASSIAHELNQPLAAIANYAQGCVRRMSSPNYNPTQIINALENISNQSKRSGDIIKRMRDFVRKGEPNRASTDINLIIQDSVQLANFEARKRGVYVHMQLQKVMPLVLADNIQIEQVVLNLIRNAFEAMDGNSWTRKELIIHSWYNTQIDMVEVAVWDTGHGISNEQRDNLFDAFFSTKPEGMGMGLSISRSIVESHGGHLSANINQVKGTTFRFSLPVVRSEAQYA